MGRSLPWLEGTDRKVSETLSLVHFFCYWQLPDAFSSGQRMQWNTICLSMKSFAANTIWPLQVYSWHAVFVFNFLLTVTVSSFQPQRYLHCYSMRHPCLCLCLYMQLWKAICRIVLFPSGLFWVVFIFPDVGEWLWTHRAGVWSLTRIMFLLKMN